MSKRQKSLDLSPFEKSYAHLLVTIRLKNNDLLRASHSQFIRLFGNIGREMIKLPDKNRKININLITNTLSERYGEFFSAGTLKKMQRFADVFTDTEIKMAARFISWEHFLVLFRVKYPDERLFYIGQIVKKHLSASELRQEIATNSFEQQSFQSLDIAKKGKASKSDPDTFERLSLLAFQKELIEKYPLAIENLFKKPYVVRFRYLMSSSAKPAITVDMPLPVQELLGSVIILIEEYKSSLNIWLNMRVSLSFREFGEYIKNEIIKHYPEPDDKNNLRGISLRLQKKFGKNFTQAQLGAMIKFAEIPIEPAIQISRMITWKYLFMLLNFEQPNKLLFYANLVAERNMDAISLRSYLDKNGHEQIPVSSLLEQNVLTETKRTKTISNNPNRKVAVITKGLDLSNIISHKDVMNIFNNPHFPIINRNNA